MLLWCRDRLGLTIAHGRDPCARFRTVSDPGRKTQPLRLRVGPDTGSWAKADEVAAQSAGGLRIGRPSDLPEIRVHSDRIARGDAAPLGVVPAADGHSDLGIAAGGQAREEVAGSAAQPDPAEENPSGRLLSDVGARVAEPSTMIRAGSGATTSTPPLRDPELQGLTEQEIGTVLGIVRWPIFRYVAMPVAPRSGGLRTDRGAVSEPRPPTEQSIGSPSRQLSGPELLTGVQ